MRDPSDTTTAGPPPAWAVLEEALVHKRRVRVRYGGHERTICPHVLGWKNRRPKVLAYQVEGTTSHGRLPPDPTERWRSMFVGDIDDAIIVEGAWQSGPNYTPTHNGIDEVALHH
jgi:hypothetical protein